MTRLELTAMMQRLSPLRNAGGGRLRAVALTCAVALTAGQLAAQKQAAAPSVEEAHRIAGQAYTFAYPLVLMEMTRRANTRNGSPRLINHFVHARAFPDDRFRQVIRPNADTLYSSSWLDLSREPMLLHVPDTKGRYYVMQFMDAWTETIASPGKRTTGTGEGWFAIVGPGWKGALPEDVRRIDCPTSTAWLIGRTQTNGPGDYDFVHVIQEGYQLTPLSAYPAGQPPVALSDLAQLQSGGNNIPPPLQVAQMSTTEFFQLFARLLVMNPPHQEDAAMVRQLARIGIIAGKSFPAVRLPVDQVKAVEDGALAAAKAIDTFDRARLPAGKTGWTLPGRYGRYGVDYQVRALAARYFLGALPAEDAVYLSTGHDAGGEPFQGSRRYVMHFDKDRTPPARAFWSLTLYDDQGYFSANARKRFAIGDRDALKFNVDGSLDIYIQHESPEAGREGNWLPAPADGFNLALRMYWPESSVVSGEWTPPAVAAVDRKQ